MKKATSQLFSKAILGIFFTLTGCAQWIPGIERVIQDFVNQEALYVMISEEAISEVKNVSVQIEITQ